MTLVEPVPGRPCWVELSTSDVPAAKTFYAALFGWRSETDPRPEAGGYTMARLGEDAVAALTPSYRPDQTPAWTVSFATEDVDATVDAVRSVGGTLLVGPMDVFEQGRFAVVADPAGAVFSLWQARAFAGDVPLQRAGHAGLGRAPHSRSGRRARLLPGRVRLDGQRLGAVHALGCGR